MATRWEYGYLWTTRHPSHGVVTSLWWRHGARAAECIAEPPRELTDVERIERFGRYVDERAEALRHARLVEDAAARLMERLGDEGWELVACTHRMYFKRPRD